MTDHEEYLANMKQKMHAINAAANVASQQSEILSNVRERMQRIEALASSEPAYSAPDEIVVEDLNPEQWRKKIAALSGLPASPSSSSSSTHGSAASSPMQSPSASGGLGGGYGGYSPSTFQGMSEEQSRIAQMALKLTDEEVEQLPREHRETMLKFRRMFSPRSGGGTASRFNLSDDTVAGGSALTAIRNRSAVGSSYDQGIALPDSPAKAASGNMRSGSMGDLGPRGARQEAKAAEDTIQCDNGLTLCTKCFDIPCVCSK
jgi:hypothetical protein